MNSAQILASLTAIVNRLIEQSEKRIKNFVLTEAVVPGPKGDKGDNGDVGPQGPKGETGPMGATGAQGPRGEVGPKGDKGERGEQGPIGIQGITGQTGAKGDKGDKGEIGPQGPQGLKGDKGESGKDGVDGLQGPQGPKGDKGDKGEIGPQGPKGDKGDVGPKGDKGDKGDRGKIGSQGPKGDPGPKGEKGDKGEIGPQGPKGDKGDTPTLDGFEKRFAEISDDTKRKVDTAIRRIQQSAADSARLAYAKAPGGGSVNILDNDDVVFKKLTNVTNGSVLSFDTNLNKFVANNKIFNMQHVSFDTTANYAVGQGELAWNADEETLDLGQNGAVLQIGQEIHYHVRNNTANTIPNGTAVMATGTLGASGRITIAPAVANGTIPPRFYIGVTTEDIPAGDDGKVTHFGKVRDINTSSYPEGSILWLDPANAGGFTTTEPQAPNWKIAAAIVINSKNNGTIFVRYATQHNFGDLNDVEINSPANNDVVVYNASTLRFENKPLTQIQNFNRIPISSNTYTLSNGDVSTSEAFIGVNNSSNTIINIQSGFTIGKKLYIKDESGNAAFNKITVNTVDIVDGSNTFTIQTNYASISMVYTGVGWSII